MSEVPDSNRRDQLDGGRRAEETDDTVSDPDGSAREREDAVRRAVREHAIALGRYCLALVGSEAEAEHIAVQSFASVFADDGGAASSRAALVAEARRRCVRAQASRPSGRLKVVADGEARHANRSVDDRARRAREALSALRPTEREALVARFVGELSYDEIADAYGVSIDEARRRASAGLSALTGTEPDGADTMLSRVHSHVAELLEGSASPELLDAVSGNERARDFLYEAERAAETVLSAAADDTLDADALEQRIADALAPSDRSEAAADAIPDLAVPSKPPADDSSAPSPDSKGQDDKADGEMKGEPPPPEVVAAASGVTRRTKGILALVALVFGLLLFARYGSKDPGAAQGEGWKGRVQQVSSAFEGLAGLERCSPDGAICDPLAAGDEIASGSLLRTGAQGRALVTLHDGSKLALDRGTSLRLLADADRSLAVEVGSIVLEVEPRDEAAVILVPRGSIELDGGRMALEVVGDRARADIVHGHADVVDAMGRRERVVAGETVEIDERGIVLSALSSVFESVGWSERAFGEPKDEVASAPPGLGELVARKPGSEQELPKAVTLASHTVSVRIVGGMARTEIEEVFENHTDDVLEGILRFPLPPDAQIERLALETDGKLEEGAFVDRDRAAAIWRGALANAAPKQKRPLEEIVWVPGPWRDPALLEWQRGGRFELRVFPIPKKGSRRVVLAYTQRVPAAGSRRRFSLPLPYDPGETAKLDRFAVEVVVRGHDPAMGVRSVGYELEAREDGDAIRMTHSARDFTPSGDLVVEYGLPDRAREVTAWAYQPGPDESAEDDAALHAGVAPDAPFALISLRPELPRWADDVRLSYAIVVDRSRSMIGQRYHQATELATELVESLGRDSSVTVIACDTTCDEIPGGSATAGRQRAEEVRAFVSGMTPEGGSDLAHALEEGLRAAARAPGAVRVVYLGDGTPTVGPTQAAFLERAVRAAVKGDNAMVTAIPLGTDADVQALETIARAGGGVVVPHVPGRRVEDTALAVLGATLGNALRDAQVILPDGLVDVAPTDLPTLPAGSETFVAARMTRPEIRGTVELRGNVGGRPFSQRYPVEIVARTNKGNAFVPRIFAARKIAELERDGSKEARERAVLLSSRYSVASRFTSLLVLESPAMFQAFGLDNQRRVATWTGDEDDAATFADGELAYGLEEERKLDADAFMGSASGAGGVQRSKPMPAAKRRRAPAPSAPLAESASGAMDFDGPLELQEQRPSPRPPPRRRRMIPMRKVWERFGKIEAERRVPSDVTETAISEAEREAAGDLRRDALAKLYRLYFQAGRIDDASAVAERWSAKDPLDPGALTARADVAAARGERARAIRILGSVVDVRPGDHKSQWRLARLHRWAGRPSEGCRHSLAVSQIRRGEAELLAQAVRCARDTGLSSLADQLLRAASEETRTATERLLKESPDDPDRLRGDLRLEAEWEGSADVDLAMVHPDGHRVSWLGAPTRSIITARDVLSLGREGLALRGAKPGQYVIEVARAGPGTTPIRGSVDVTVGKEKRTVPFSLSGDRAVIGVAKIQMRSRLVPVNAAWSMR